MTKKERLVFFTPAITAVSHPLTFLYSHLIDEKKKSIE